MFGNFDFVSYLVRIECLCSFKRQCQCNLKLYCVSILNLKLSLIYIFFEQLIKHEKSRIISVLMIISIINITGGDYTLYLNVVCMS